MTDTIETSADDNSERYIGREGIVRRIFSRIGAERPQSVALIGGRKMGKTTLLRYMYREPVREQHLGSGFRFGYLSCKDVDSPTALLMSLARQFSNASPRENYTYDDFRELLEDFFKDDGKIILLMDDFHLITGSSAFPLEFFSFFRSMANNFNIAYVTSSLLELQQLCAVKDVEESPFFNIFTNITLTPLDIEDGCTLLTLLTGWEPAEAKAVVEWSGGIPYTAELIAAVKDEHPPAQEKTLSARYGPVLHDYFRDIVSMLKKEAYDPLRRVAKQRPVDPSRSYLVRYLVKQGFLNSSGKKLLPYSPAFGNFLKSALSQEMLGEERRE